MKVLLLNGSPRQNGNTFLALSEVAKVLNEKGVETGIVQIGTKPIRGCIACGKCAQNANNQCVFNDDMCNQLSAKMQECDGLIVGTPVYYGQPNGSLLCLVQRMLYSANTYFAGKPVACVAVCRRGGATAALQSLQMAFQLQHMPIVTSQYWNIVYGREVGQAVLDLEGMQTMRSLGLNMALEITARQGKQQPQYEPRQPMHFIR